MDRAAVRKLESSGKVAIATIAENILPALSVPESQADWGYLLVISSEFLLQKLRVPCSNLVILLHPVPYFMSIFC